MASEDSAQKFVHELEHGKGRWWIAFLLLLFVVIAQIVAFLFINPLNFQGGRQEMFRGLSHAKGMEQAIISREIMRGHGFSTTAIKPAAIHLMESNTKQPGSFTNYMASGGPTQGHIPDYFHAPLNPAVNALALAAAEKINQTSKTALNEDGTPNLWKIKTGELSYPADRIIAGVSVFFFILSAWVNYFTARLIFDRRLALLALLMVLFCSVFWDFASTGLPQLLMLFLFSLGMQFYIRGLLAKENAGSPWLWMIAAGICFGLLILAHGLAAFLLIGLLIHAALTFRPIGREAGILAALALLIVAPWLARTHHLTHTFGGLATETKLFQIRGTESQIMRTLTRQDETIQPSNFRSKIQAQAIAQIKNLTGHLGNNLIAPFFFLALLFNYKKSITRSLRWAVFLMWLFAAFGMAYFGFSDYDLQVEQQSNDLYLLFIPFFIFYGLSLVLMFWSRLEIQGKEIASLPFFSFSFQALIVVINSLPLLTRYTDPPLLRMVWPPYAPPLIANLSDWFTEKDVICTDMPWAVSWYADRRSLWLPLTIADFNELNDFRLNGRITGLFLTPVTGNRGLLTDVGIGEFKDWSAFIMRNPNARSNFPLSVARPIYIGTGANYILYADRDRWTERND